jgi:NADPH-dependent 7-cyano-7-deazaguanine reductase QueF
MSEAPTITGRELMGPEGELVVVAAPAGAVVTATGEVSHLCPYKDEEDEGTVTIRWRTITSTIELHSLRTYIDLFDEALVSHELLADQFTEDISRLGGIELLDITLRFPTAGFEVTVNFGGAG